MRNFREASRAAGPRPSEGKSFEKKNYAEVLSRHLATVFANLLRKDFKPITPDESGSRQEEPARTAKGTKTLDVNYSVPQLGLGLGVSIKTLNFRDRETARYTKNYTRIDNELRAEALDYHERQPWAVLIAVVFIPVDACDDYKNAQDRSSSFGQAVKIFRPRANRNLPSDAGEGFERVFIGLYAPADDDPWDVKFFDVDEGASERRKAGVVRRPRARRGHRRDRPDVRCPEQPAFHVGRRVSASPGFEGARPRRLARRLSTTASRFSTSHSQSTTTQ